MEYTTEGTGEERFREQGGGRWFGDGGAGGQGGAGEQARDRPGRAGGKGRGQTGRGRVGLVLNESAEPCFDLSTKRGKGLEGLV